MSVYKPKVNPKIYGLHIPYDQGYDAWSQRNYPAAEQGGSSGYFQRSDLSRIEMWITKISADFSISGETGQSRMTREFFPRSFNDVTLTITGNVAGTEQYNRLAAFVREAHWRALQSISQGSVADPTIAFGLYDSPDNNGVKPFDKPRRSTKGSHRPWQVQGYVQNMVAGAIAHEVAPEFTIAFIVTASTLSASTGIWSDTPAGVPHLRNFLSMVAAQEKVYHGSGFTANPVTALLPHPQTVEQIVGKGATDVWSAVAAFTHFSL